MPARGIFSTGLPSTQPTARPSQAAYTRSRRASGSGAGIRGATRSPRAATMADQLLGSSTSLGGRHRVQLVQQPAGQRDLLRSGRIGRGAGGEGPDRSPGGDPPTLHVGDIPALVRRLRQLVAQQVLRLRPGHPHIRPPRGCAERTAGRRRPPGGDRRPPRRRRRARRPPRPSPGRPLRGPAGTPWPRSPPTLRHRRRPAERAGDRPAHGGDRVGVAAVVGRAEDGGGDVAAGDLSRPSATGSSSIAFVRLGRRASGSGFRYSSPTVSNGRTASRSAAS